MSNKFTAWLKAYWWIIPIMLAVALISIYSIGKLFGLYTSLYNDGLVWFFTLSIIGSEIGGLSVVARMHTLEFTGRKRDIALSWLAVGLIVGYEVLGNYGGSVATMYGLEGDAALSLASFGTIAPETAGVIFAAITAIVLGVTNFIYIKIVTGMVIAGKELSLIDESDAISDGVGNDEGVEGATPEEPF